MKVCMLQIYINISKETVSLCQWVLETDVWFHLQSGLRNLDYRKEMRALMF